MSRQHHDAQIGIELPDNPKRLNIRMTEGTETRAMDDILRSRCPSVYENFRPPWWLRSGHLQTMFTAVCDPELPFDPELFHRKIIQLKDGGSFALDIHPKDLSCVKNDAPIVVIFGGLTGSSGEGYVKEILCGMRAAAPDKKLQHRVVYINYRGCGGVPLTSPRVYTCGNTDDVRIALALLSRLYPNSTMHGLGFSLGSAIMTRYAAEEGKECRLRSICCLACPWNFEANSKALSSTFLGRQVYSRALGFGFRKIIKRDIAIFRESEDYIYAAAKHVVAVKGITLQEFDDTFTRIIPAYGPNFRFSTLRALYEWGSCDDLLQKIEVPALYINALDDPVVQSVPKNAGGSKQVILVTTPHGGHLGWHTAATTLREVKRWTTVPILQWLQLMIFDIIHDECRPPKVLEDVNGFVYEVRYPEIGCRIKSASHNRSQSHYGGGSSPGH